MAEYLAWKSGGADEFFGAPDPALERTVPVPSDVLTHEHIETSYFGFSIPEERINGTVYYWFHPAFGVASGGVVIQRGFAESPARGDYAEWRNFLPMPEDITDCTYANGVSVKMIRPLEEFHVAFSDPARDTALDLHLEAVMPAAFRPMGGHLSQAMRTRGTLRLNGVEYPIDGFTTRDRSWGDPRSEGSLDIPPISWAVPVFGEDFACHFMGFDSAELIPGWEERYPSIANGRNLLWGYVWTGGELLGITGCHKRTTRDETTGRPSAMWVELTDERGGVHTLEGTVIGANALTPWPANTTFVCLVEWRCGERVGHGDLQESVYPQYWNR